MRDIQKVIDALLEGVQSISEAAAHELFLKAPPGGGTFIEPINLEPAVARRVWHAVRFGE